MPETVTIFGFHQFGDASVLQLDQLPLPSSGEGEFRLMGEAIGLNCADIMFRNGQYVAKSGPNVSHFLFSSSRSCPTRQDSSECDSS